MTLPCYWRSCSSSGEKLFRKASGNLHLGCCSRTWRYYFCGCGRESHSKELHLSLPLTWRRYSTTRSRIKNSVQSRLRFVCEPTKSTKCRRVIQSRQIQHVPSMSHVCEAPANSGKNVPQSALIVRRRAARVNFISCWLSLVFFSHSFIAYEPQMQGIW